MFVHTSNVYQFFSIGMWKQKFPILLDKFGLKFDDVTDSMKIVQICAAIHNFILKNQNPEEIRQEEGEENLQNLADFRFPRNIVIDPNAPIVPDGSVATHDYLLTKYRDYFRPAAP